MNDILLSKIRLGVMAELLPNEWVAFSELQRAIGATNGNLGAHLARLIQSGYITEEKAFVDRRPQTRYRLTRAGRNAFLKHVAELQALVATAK
jgi:DNA-binding MarR family transcriptional regulator